jgi:hypothetical protein
MSAVVRPTYYETQVLAAADLEAQLEYARTALARHERHQHSFGVVFGLDVTKSGDNVAVAPGMLVDGTGRQVVLADGAGLTPEQFVNFGVVSQNDAEDTWYAVFVSGRDKAQQPSPFRREQCNSLATSRIDELVEISVGRPGSELNPLPAPGVDAAPGGAPGVDAWPVVVGFVQWSRADSTFKDAKSQPDALHQPRYAGVYADVVAARGGSLTLRTRPDVEAGRPAMLLQEQPWQFQVGRLKPNGNLDALLTLNQSGDLTVSGKLKGTLAAGSIVAESGVVSDGVTIALPAGVTEQMVTDGDAQVCVMLAPRIDPRDAPTTADVWAAYVLECYADSARQAHCRVRWMRLSTPTGIEDRSTSFAYLITASVKQS